MLSIIVCSRNSKLKPDFTNNINNTIGIDYELICIDNSENKYTIFSAYNEGLKQTKYKNLCFLHDDVYFETPDWGKKIMIHLSTPNVGLLGMAGGDAAFRVPYDWTALNPSVNIQHEVKNIVGSTELIFAPKNYANALRSVVMLDGVMLCAKREVFEIIKFDESLGSFHGYDFDISLQSTFAGYNNYVMYDISLIHFSHGIMDATYFQTMVNVFKKWEKHLPIFEHNISLEERKNCIPQVEKQRLNKLLKRMVRARMNMSEIAEIYVYYTKLIGTKIEIFLLLLIRLRIILIYITSVFRNKMN